MVSSSRPALKAGKRDTEALIIEAAERLFAKSGVDGVSFRQIGAAAGAANHFAVQYHFGDKARLVQAIFASHLPSMEAARARMLTAVTRAGRLDDPRALTEIVLLPIAEEVDREGRRTFAAFVHRLGHFEALRTWRRQAAELAPLTEHVLALLRGALPHIPDEWFSRRLHNATTVFVTALAEWDDQVARGYPSPFSEEAVLSDAMESAAAALCAPLSPLMRTELRG